MTTCERFSKFAVIAMLMIVLLDLQRSVDETRRLDNYRVVGVMAMFQQPPAAGLANVNRLTSYS